MKASASSRSGMMVKKAKEPVVIYDQGVFHHETGDTYEGAFEAKKRDRSIKMHGHGTYKTAEGDSYVGVWERDKLVGEEEDEATISYSDGSEYQGCFENWQYSGSGQFTYSDGSVLRGEFSDNAPRGSLALTDANGNEWLGQAELGYAWFAPVNHYYDILEKPKDNRKLKKRRITISELPKRVAPVDEDSNTDEEVNEYIEEPSELLIIK